MHLGAAAPMRWWAPTATGIALVLAGLAQAGALAWPGHGAPLWWLHILSLAGFIALLQRSPSASSALLRSATFATAWLVGTFWWLFISMHQYGGLAAPLAALAVLALALFLASYYAAAGWFYWKICRLRRMGQAQAALFFIACWLLAELARGALWTGFPWGAGGYAHVDGPLALLAPWLGVYGVGAAASATAWMLAQGLGWRPLAALALVLLALGLVQHQRLQAPPPDGPGVRVALLQGNIAQDEKFQPGSGVPLALAWYAQELRAAQADLVVAPETAIPLLPQQLVPGYLEALQNHFERPVPARAALLGIPLGDATQGYTNSVLGWAPTQSTPYHYDKHHLVPFGEFIPPLFKWFTQLMNIPLGDFIRGALGQPSMAWAGQRWAPNICYEDLFGEEISQRFADPASAPTVLVNLSNIGWFGDSVAIDQHLHISRMRALEFARPVVRATNTGATAIIDHLGRVTARLPAHQRGVLYGPVWGREELTFFARWSAWGALLPLWLLGAGTVLLIAGRALRPARTPPV